MNLDKAEWIFEPFTSMGGTGARGLKRTLTGSGLEEAVLFGREIIQNCGDASIESLSPKVNFKLDSIQSRFSDVLWKNLQTDKITERPGIMSPSNSDIPVLYIEDYNTYGLTGTHKAEDAVSDELTTEYKNRYVGLCLTFGNAEADVETGGTFGFGKSVLWEISKSGIVLFYSKVKKCKQNSDVSSLFLGCGLFNQHNFNGKRFTGRAFFGRKDSEGNLLPLTDDLADKFAECFNFMKRKDDEFGTSIAVIDSKFDSIDHLVQIKKGIEKYYWPKIIDNKIDIELSENINSFKPEPKKRADLKPFITAYEKIKSENQTFQLNIQNNQSVSEVKYDNKLLGNFAICSIEEDDSSNIDNDTTVDSVDPLVDTIALIRKHGMVISYHAPYKRSVDRHFAGVFMADNSVNKMLAKSEPPTHNLWDSNCQSLNTGEKRKVVSIFNQIKQYTRDFISSQRRNDIDMSNTCSVLDRAFADVIKMRKISGTAPGGKKRGNSSPVKPGPDSQVNQDSEGFYTYEFIDSPEIDTIDGKAFYKCTVLVKINSKEKRLSSKNKLINKAAFFNLNVRAMILVDGGSHDSDDLPVDSMQISLGESAEMIKPGQLKIPLGEDKIEHLIVIKTKQLLHDEQAVDFKLSGSFSTR